MNTPKIILLSTIITIIIIVYQAVVKKNNMDDLSVWLTFVTALVVQICIFVKF